MDLALNNLQRLICHKTQQTNKPNQKEHNIIISGVISTHMGPVYIETSCNTEIIMVYKREKYVNLSSPDRDSR